MANTNEIDYPAEDTIGDQCVRGLIKESRRPIGEPPVLPRELHRRISRIAYQLYLQRGKLHGRDLEDWPTAESLVLRPLTELVDGAEDYDQ
jgi:hypothetical protein